MDKRSLTIPSKILCECAREMHRQPAKKRRTPLIINASLSKNPTMSGSIRTSMQNVWPHCCHRFSKQQNPNGVRDVNTRAGRLLCGDCDTSFETPLSLPAVYLIWYLYLRHADWSLGHLLVFGILWRLPSIALCPTTFFQALRSQCASASWSWV